MWLVRCFLYLAGLALVANLGVIAVVIYGVLFLYLTRSSGPLNKYCGK